MARLFTSGAETNSLDTLGAEGVGVLLLLPSVVTSPVRSGSYAYEMNTGAGNSQTASIFSGFTGATARDYFFRAYVSVPALPGTTASIMGLADAGFTNGVEVRLTTAGKLQLWNLAAGTQIGSDSVDALATSRWYRVELHLKVGTSSADDAADLYMDGILVASTTTATIATTAPGQIRWGWHDNTALPGANTKINFDDIALNDGTGASQTSYPGEGKVVLLVPTSDNSAGSWKAGSAASASSNGALFDAINNLPPAGTVSPDGVLACISNAVSGVTTPNGDFNMQTYASKGIATYDVINCMQMGIVHGEDVSTNSKTGTFNIQSNPSHVTNAIQGPTTGQFGPDAGGAVGAYPGNNWVAQWGTVFYGDVVTPATAPVARITKTDTGTRAADCCFMGILVDFTPVGPYPAVNMAPRRA